MQYNEQIPIEIGSAARKREEYERWLDEPKVKKEKVVKNSPKKATKAQKKVSIFIAIMLAFSMTFLLTYRYNVISEKNLEVQNLKNELDKTESLLATAKIDVESNTDFTAIESYAKQQLGMQKPTANQIVYVDSSTENSLIEKSQTLSFFASLISNVKEKLQSIF